MISRLALILRLNMLIDRNIVTYTVVREHVVAVSSEVVQVIKFPRDLASGDTNHVLPLVEPLELNHFRVSEEGIEDVCCPKAQQ